MSVTSPLFVLLAMVPVLASLLLGAQLRPEYLTAVVRQPRALLVGLVGQYLILPGVAIAFFYLFPAPPHLGWAWFVLAAVPGGAISNMATFLGRGRLSLSVVLTACSTVSCMVTIPLWLKVGSVLTGAGTVAMPPLGRTALGSFLLLTVPLAVGIAAGLWRPRLAERLREHTRVAMLVLLIVGAVAYAAQRWTFMAGAFDPATVVGAALFHVTCVGGAWLLARANDLPVEDRFTVGIETGVQNVVVALLIAELLGRSDLVPFIGYYMLSTFLFVFLWAGVARRRAPA